jgi:hypothetical protein
VLTEELVENLPVTAPDPVIDGLFQLADGLRFITTLKEEGQVNRPSPYQYIRWRIYKR